MSSKKKLCDLKKWLKRDVDSYLELVADPTHLCISCGRVANCKRRLCDAKRLPEDMINQNRNTELDTLYV
ncbi:MAG: hypothetical protein KDB27_32320 [Planctomycetales bacterium]|nr:hypothetical protein [Planctomycetales bacterium]